MTDSRAKTDNLRRDPRASLHVTSPDFWSFVVLDGTVALSPVAARSDDPVVGELVEMYRLASGEHPDWDEFRRAMVAQGRVVATLTPTYAYGQMLAADRARPVPFRCRSCRSHRRSASPAPSGLGPGVRPG